jgi:hypothetical protein
MPWGVLASVAGSLITSSMSGGSSGNGGQPTQQQQQVYDPYAPYRGAAAQQLNALMADPSKAQSLPNYQAMQQAAARTMAAQGYTGSGNALVAAASAGGQAYQQDFNNLAMLAGAGQSPAYAAGMANNAAMGQQQMQNGMWGTLGNDFGHWFGGGTGSSGSSYGGSSGSYSGFNNFTTGSGSKYASGGGY